VIESVSLAGKTILLAPQAAGAFPAAGPSMLGHIIPAISDLIYVFNHKTRANDYTNRSVGAYLGYDSAEIHALGERLFMHVVYPDDQPVIQRHIDRIARLEDTSSASIEYRVVTKIGRLRWLRSVDTVFERGPDGSVLRHIGCAHDITALKRAQLDLSQLNARLEKEVAQRTRDLADLNAELEARFEARTLELQDAVEELEQLTYIATHDLKVPVNNLSRLALMLYDTAPGLTPEQAEQVDWISQCADQLSAKIQGLVLVAQIRLGGSLPSRMLSVHDAVLQTVKSMEMANGQLALPVVLDIPPDIEVYFSPVELDSIISSLIDNAVKYADPSRALRIVIRVQKVQGQVTLAVADNGTGLDHGRDGKKVFGLFQRAHKSPAGSGISLYCARRMLLRCGGSLQLSGQRGVGAEFKLVFPTGGSGQ